MNFQKYYILIKYFNAFIIFNIGYIHISYVQAKFITHNNEHRNVCALKYTALNCSEFYMINYVYQTRIIT